MLNAIVEFEGRVIAAGRTEPDRPTILVFESGTWSPAEVPTAKGQVLGMALYRDMIVAVGHHLDPFLSSSFIWTSRDGRSWQEAETLSDAALYGVVATARSVVAVGDRVNADDEPIATSWSSTDGLTWERGSDAATRRSSLHVVTPFKSALLAAGLQPDASVAPIWRSTDAARWTAVRSNLSSDVRPLAIAESKGRAVVAGAIGPSAGDKRTFVALSSDGVTYRRRDVSREVGYVNALTTANDALVAAGVDADRLMVWRESGDTWRQQQIEATGATVNAMTVDADLGLIGVGTRDGRLAAWILAEDRGG